MKKIKSLISNLLVADWIVIMLAVLFMCVFYGYGTKTLTQKEMERVMTPEELRAEQQRQARTTVKRIFEQSPEGDSYKPIAWGRVEVNSPYAGTGTKTPIYGNTGTPPSEYSITHRLRMRNGFGTLMTFDIRVFFTDESCTRWAGMEYMDDDDPTRYFLQK